MVEENVRAVHETIERACERSGRKSQEVSLICVSKTKPVELMMEAYQAGERIFGENRAQEIVKKAPLMPDDTRWHMIGHLQRNKVRSIIGIVELIHSVDSYRLAETIDEEARRIGKVMDILLEVNVAEEESKFGLKPEEVAPLAAQIQEKLPNVRLRGLMTVAPFVDNPENNREVFRKLKNLTVDISGKNHDNNCDIVLSMGMTGDYAVAVEEGAGFVRVGTGIFGERSTAAVE